MTAPAKAPTRRPCTGGHYPLFAAGAWRRTCDCPEHFWNVHPGWNPPVLDEDEPDAN